MAGDPLAGGPPDAVPPAGAPPAPAASERYADVARIWASELPGSRLLEAPRRDADPAGYHSCLTEASTGFARPSIGNLARLSANGLLNLLPLTVYC